MRLLRTVFALQATRQLMSDTNIFHTLYKCRKNIIVKLLRKGVVASNLGILMGIGLS